MSLTQDLNNSKELKELFALDKVLRNLGLWFGPLIRGSSDEERKAALAELDFKEPYILSNSGYDPNGQQIISVTSETSYEEGTGTLDDKIIFWKHAPYDQSGGPEASEHYVIAMRYKRNPYQDENDLPVLVPEQIWINGKNIFNSTLNGGGDSPTEPKFRRLIDRVQELSQRTKETLMEREPIEDLAMILADGKEGDNIIKEIAGGSPFLEGLSAEGGFSKTLTPFFLDIIQEEGETLKLNCSSAQTLKAVHGFTENTIEKIRSLRNSWEKSATHMAAGMRYVTLPQYRLDEKTGRHIFSLNCYPENPPKDMEAPEEIEIARMEYALDDDGLYVLKDWNFFESDKNKFRTLSKQHKLLGLFQKCLQYLNKNKYPPINDIVYEVGLDDALSEFRAPPTLEEGHECLWTPYNGRDFEKKAGPGGDSLGGGNGFLMRYKKESGNWSEKAILIDVPYQPFGPKGDWEGIQPNFGATWDVTGTVYLTHDHFDHATLEYMAYQGLLKGKRVVCSESVEHIVRARMTTLGVKKEDMPMFVNYNDPDSGIIKLGENHYVDVIKDDDGNIRGYMQICRGGALHTADVDTMMWTPCFNDDQWGETYFTYGDTYELSGHGKRFAAQGQLGLLMHPGISDEAKAKLIEQTVPFYKDGEERKIYDDTPLLKELCEKYPDRNFAKLYIAMHDPTNCTMAGHAPRPEEVKNTWRELLKLCNDDMIFHVPFSTNSAELRSMAEVISEKETLRNSTGVGGNMEIRGSVENMYGADPKLDLRDFKLPPEKHPEILYDTAFRELQNKIIKLEERADEKASKRKDKKTAEDILAEDKPYQVLKLIEEKAQGEFDNGNIRPDILYQCFLAEGLDIWPELFKETGFEIKEGDKEPDYESLKKIPYKAFEAHQNSVKTQLYYDLDIETFRKENPKTSYKSIIDYWANSDAAYWCIKSILKNGHVQFDQLKRCSQNEKRMYQALMNDQDTASLHHTRTSKIGKFFRKFADRLLIHTTGPFGTAEEQFATLYRYAYGDSLFDYDEFVRNTGYFIDDDTPKTIFVTQTPSTGRTAQLAQDKLMRAIVENKSDTVFCATKNGFKVYNPKEKLEPMLARFKELGWEAKWDAKNKQIHVHDVPYHIHGHQFREDLRDTVKNCRAKLHTVIHNPGWENYIAAREIVEQEGGNFDHSDMKDFVGIKAGYNEQSGELEHEITDYLTPSFWLSRVRRKYGQMYGGGVEMMRAIVLRDDGNKKFSGTQVRRAGRGNSDGAFGQKVAHQAKTDFAHAADMEHSARASQVGFSKADVRAPAKPRSPGMAEMIAMQLKADNSKTSAYVEPGGMD